jgi:endonuclease YncB( thermonuclease family)
MTDPILINSLCRINNNDIEEFSLDGMITLGKLVDIYDGDTCKIVLIVNNKLQKFTCRLIGIDTPEMKPSLNKPDRDKEIKAAHHCRNKIIQLGTNCKCELSTIMKKTECKSLLLTNTKLIKVKCHEFDKYGRLLVTIYALPSVAGTSVAGTSVAGTSVAGTSVAGTSVAGTSVAGTSTSLEVETNKSINTILVECGLAKSYDGGTKNVFVY